MNNIMLDLETMGNKRNAAIATIGAVFFDPATGETGPEFYAKVDLEDAAKYLTIDAGTVVWWLQQSDEARQELYNGERMTLIAALKAFKTFVIENTTEWKATKVWGNGATFDNVILTDAFNAVKISRPWPYWGDSDVRTLVELGRNLFDFDPKHDMPFDGEKHNALADAIHQAKYVSAIYQKISSSNQSKAA